MLIGNKIDLESQRMVTSDQGSQLAKEKNMFFMEVSAKTNQDSGVEKAFTILLEEIVKKTEERMIESKVYEIQSQKLVKSKERNPELVEGSQNRSGICC